MMMPQQASIGKHSEQHSEQRAKQVLLPPLQPPMALTPPHCVPFCLPRPIPRSLSAMERVMSERACSITSERACWVTSARGTGCGGSNVMRPKRPEQVHRLAPPCLLCHVGVLEAAENIHMRIHMEASVGICRHISSPAVASL